MKKTAARDFGNNFLILWLVACTQVHGFQASSVRGSSIFLLHRYGPERDLSQVPEQQAYIGKRENRRAFTALADTSLPVSDEHPRRRALRQVFPITTSLVIGGFSVLEILEGLREPRDRRMGRAHGVLILAVIRLFRSAAILQTEIGEVGEDLEKMGLDEEALTKGPVRVLQRLGHFLVSPLVSITACIVAVVACFVEIYDDLKPGTHHGAALLALSELSYQLRRFWQVSKVDERAAFVHKVPKRTFMRRIPIGMMVGLAAAMYAAIELIDDLKPGAHHGVALLAFAEMVENVNRAKVLQV